MANSFVAVWTVARQGPLWDFSGKNTGVGYHFLLQGILLTQGLNCISCIGSQILYHSVTRKAQQ